MTQSLTGNAVLQTNKTSQSALYRTIWKWHFFAALYVLPFMALLSITGGIYLYQTQIEEIIYKDRLNVEIGEELQPFEDQAQAALASVTNAKKIRSFAVPQSPTRATIFEVQNNSRERIYVWVNPYTNEVIEAQNRDDTLMRIVRKLHGELLLGKTGTKFVELAAHWSVVLMITGIYLWRPRGNRNIAKAIKPDFIGPDFAGKNKRTFWKNAHRWIGMFAAILITPILISGLPWTDIWGGSLKQIQTWTDQKSPSRAFGGAPINSSEDNGVIITAASAIELAKQNGVIAPIEVRLPKNEKGTYFIRSKAPNPMDRVELHIDQYSGAIQNKVTWADFKTLPALVSGGIAFHEGRLYGTLNLVQNTFAAIIGVILSVTGFYAWWRRKPKGELGVPKVPDTFKASPLLLGLIIALAILLPLMGASLTIMLVLDWLIFSRMGWFQNRIPNS